MNNRTVLAKKIRKNRFFYLFFIPVALYFILFSYFPLLKGLVMSFQANRLIGKRPFVGFENYQMVIGDIGFIQSIGNSLIIGLADMALYFLLSLVLALSINELRSAPFKKVVQTIAFIPYLLSWSVIGGIWAAIFNLSGVINEIIKLFGGDPVFFLGNQALARPLVIAMGTWRSIGYFAILYLASIISIDQSIYESARIDGANRWQQIIYITVPSLTGTMKTILILLSIGVLTHFSEIFVMRNPGNMRVIDTVLMYVYETGIINFKMGIATAGATLVMLATLVVVFVTKRFIKYE